MGERHDRPVLQRGEPGGGAADLRSSPQREGDLTSGNPTPGRLALVYLARGADADYLPRFRRFLESYRRFRAGEEHRLVVVFKGFENAERVAEAQDTFRPLDYDAVFTADDSFDLGSYRAAAEQLPHERVCFLNSNSEIVCDGWLRKLAVNFDAPGVGLVGATGSFESLPGFPTFPNPHVRTNAFMIRRELFLDLLPKARFATKWDTYSIESGPMGVTQQVFERGLSALVVGRDGRGYSPTWWPHSRTFRQGSQSNLLVHDNATRMFERLTFGEKIEVSRRTWGEFLSRDKHL